MIKLNLLGYRTIILTQGNIALVDRADHKSLNTISWYSNLIRGTHYAMYHKAGKTLCMHRAILGTIDSKIFVDHKNHDTLDNRRHNLRECSSSENQHNRKRNKGNKSGFKGVSWHVPMKKWRARLFLNGKEIVLGYFNSPEEAHVAYNEGSTAYFGEFALINSK